MHVLYPTTHQDPRRHLSGRDAHYYARADVTGWVVGSLVVAALLGVAVIALWLATSSASAFLVALGAAIVVAPLLALTVILRAFRAGDVTAACLGDVVLETSDPWPAAGGLLSGRCTVSFKRPTALACLRIELHNRVRTGLDSYGRAEYRTSTSVLHKGGRTGERVEPLTEEFRCTLPATGSSALRLSIAPRGGRHLFAVYALPAVHADS